MVFRHRTQQAPQQIALAAAGQAGRADRLARLHRPGKERHPVLRPVERDQLRIRLAAPGRSLVGHREQIGQVRVLQPPGRLGRLANAHGDDARRRRRRPADLDALAIRQG